MAQPEPLISTRFLVLFFCSFLKKRTKKLLDVGTELNSARSLAPRLILVCLCLALWLPGFFTLPPGDRDESRFAQATKQMIQSGDFVRIMNGTEARNRKPVGIYWLQVPFVMAAQAAGLATKNPIWPYRLPSLLGAIAAVLATFDIALTLTQDPRTALLAGGMLAGTVILTVEAHIAKTDAALLGTTSWAMAMLARAWMGRTLGAAQAALFWLTLGLGILIKGPIAPMVAGLCILTLAIWHKSITWLRPLRPAWGVPLMLATVMPWFIAIEIATHGAFLAQSVGGDLGSKLAGGSESHGGFFGEHLLLLPLLAFPSSLAVIGALPASWRHRAAPGAKFLAAWALPSWLVFELAPTKLPHYTLPLYPALCIAAASWHYAHTNPPRWLAPIARAGLWISACLLGCGGLALALWLLGPWWLALPAIPAAAAAAWFAQTQRPWPALLAAIPLYATIFVTLPAIQNLWIAPRVEAALQRDWPGWNPNGTGLAVAGYAEPSLMFETGTNTQLLPDGKSAALALATGKASIILVERRTEQAFLSAAQAKHLSITKIDEIDGFNPSRGRTIALSIYK
jgi:4-amino-4-deoxy-L-arabinose transferase-like glycosyltransferase